MPNGTVLQVMIQQGVYTKERCLQHCTHTHDFSLQTHVPLPGQMKDESTNVSRSKESDAPPLTRVSDDDQTTNDDVPWFSLFFTQK